jgi:hypothetical protein
MPNRKKPKKKPAKAKRTAGKKAKLAKSRLKKSSSVKKSARKKPAVKKKTAAKAKTTVAVKSATGAAKKTGAAKQTTRKKRGPSGGGAFLREQRQSRSGELAGDLQGLSDIEGADSESVDELLEEGNAFEAGIVAGVEDAGNRGVKEVRTREVPEDDVPGEYLEKDQ